MANDINKEDPHYKGEFGSIYEVNRKFPTGGVAGDFVVIEGWAHYWNADRGTWCVNAERDSYWDELITNIIEKFKLVRGATYMGVASLDTVPAKTIGAKMYYFATVAGTYKKFDNLVVPQGINVLYSENGSSWVNTTLLEVAQELGVSTNKVVSQKALNDALNLKANQSSVNEALAKKADKEEMNRLLSAKANTADVNTKFAEEKKRVNAELDKKSNAEEVNSSLKHLKDTDTQHENRLLALEQSEWPLSLELNLTPSLLEYTGSEKDVSVSWKVSRKGAELVPTALAIKQDGVALTAGPTASGSINAKVNKIGDTLFEISVTADSMQKTVVSKLTMVLPIYCGFGTSETDVAVDANKLSPRTSANGTYAKTSAKDNVNFIILVPKTMPGLSSFTMGGAPFVMTTSSVVINNHDYYMYKSGGIYMSGTEVKVQAN